MKAVKEGLVSDHHVWFTPVWATLNLRENVNDSCTNEQLRKALSHNFGVLGSDFVLYGDSQTMAPLVSGQVGESAYLVHVVCIYVCAHKYTLFVHTVHK